MEYKYTTDGKKVAVIGKLNNTETIVQEVFVIDGNELPSGENFVVKSLHDKPAVSWKKNEIEKMDKLYEDSRLDYDKRMKELNSLRNRAAEVYKSCASIIKNTNPEMFESINKIISGKYNFVVAKNYYSPSIHPINDFIIDKDGYNYSMKLLTVFGKSDGNFEWGINRWNDGSGGWSEFTPCETIEEAYKVAVSFIEEKEAYSKTQIDFLKTNNLPVNEQKLNAYLAKERSICKAEYEKAKIEVARLGALLGE